MGKFHDFLPNKFVVRFINLQFFPLIVDRYFQYAGGFKPRTAFDITATGPKDYFDPMFIVEAVKE